jgi:OmpA-OmpF porin, OOP family
MAGSLPRLFSHGAFLAVLSLASGCADQPPPPPPPHPPHCGPIMVFFFGPGSVSLTDYARSYLARLVTTSNEPCGLNLDPRRTSIAVVTGHADKSGSEERKEQLGLQRARSVAAYLVELGAARENLCGLSRGSKRYLVAKDGPEPQNRRVEVSVVRRDNRPEGCT